MSDGEFWHVWNICNLYVVRTELYESFENNAAKFADKNLCTLLYFGQSPGDLDYLYNNVDPLPAGFRVKNSLVIKIFVS